MASSALTLAHYNDRLPLVLTTDASPVGLGACLFNKVLVDSKMYLHSLYYTYNIIAVKSYRLIKLCNSIENIIRMKENDNKIFKRMLICT